MDFFEGQYGHQKEDGQGDVKAHAAQDACGEALGEENGLSNGEDGSADDTSSAGSPNGCRWHGCPPIPNSVLRRNPPCRNR